MSLLSVRALWFLTSLLDQDLLFTTVKYLSNVLNSLPEFSHFLPATTLVAILIFLIKELLEGRRRKASDVRKIQALKTVLARDCQLNFSAIGRLRDTFIEMRESGVTEDATRLSVLNRPAGGFAYTITNGRASSVGGILVGVQREYLLKHLVEIAGLDKGFYLKCQVALDGLSEAGHVYESLVHGPDKHFPSSPESYYEGLIDYGLTELDNSIVALKELYLACTGSVLEQGKLR